MALFNLTAGAKIDEAKYYAKMGGIGGGVAGLAAGTATGGLGRGLKWGIKGVVGGSAGGALSPTVQRVTASEIPMINIIAVNTNELKIKSYTRQLRKLMHDRMDAVSEISPTNRTLQAAKKIKPDDPRLISNNEIFKRAKFVPDHLKD